MIVVDRAHGPESVATGLLVVNAILLSADVIANLPVLLRGPSSWRRRRRERASA